MSFGQWATKVPNSARQFATLLVPRLTACSSVKFLNLGQQAPCDRAWKPWLRKCPTFVRQLKTTAYKILTDKKTENMKFIYYNLFFILVTLTSCSIASNQTTLFQTMKTFKIQSKQVGEEKSNQRLDT